MDSNKIKIVVIVTMAAFVALYLGVAAATAQFEAVAWVLGVGGFVFLLSLGRHVWAVIPIAAALSGGLTFIPGYPQPWYAATPVIAGFMLLRFLVRSDMFMFRWTWLDTFMALQAGALLQAYIRNPTGLALFSDSTVGGRPYFDYGVAITSYFLLAVVKTDAKIFKRVAIAVLLMNVGDDLLRAATGFSGTFAQAVARFYGNVDYGANEAGSAFAFDLQTTRFGGLGPLGLGLGLICFSFNRPLNCFFPFKLWPFILLVISGVSTLLSGFRSGIIRLGCYFIAGSLIRKKPFDIVLGGMVASLGILLLGATFGLTRLPDPVQRALSFLPFEVSDEARDGAKASSDWRFEMWKIVLTSDRYIQNKLLGDGFGYSMAEHEAQMKALKTGVGYGGDSIDMFIAKGSYHGWHVEAIRFTGVLGLIVGLILLFAFAYYAWMAIRHYQGSEYFSFVVFICMPFLIEPFFHIVVFGSYKSTFIELISAAGILRLLDNIRVKELAEARATAAVSVNEPVVPIRPRFPATLAR
jgi:hypothetical protein